MNAGPSAPLTSASKVDAAGNRMLEHIFDSSFDGMFAFDREMKLVVFNPAMERLWGRSRQDVLGRSVLEAFPFLIAIGEDEYFTAALAGKSVVARDRPYRARSAAGPSFFGARYSPIFDDTGNVIGGLGVVRDTTDHTFNAALIGRERERLHALLGSAHELIFFKSPDYVYTAVNAALAEFLGLDDPADA